MERSRHRYWIRQGIFFGVHIRKDLSCLRPSGNHASFSFEITFTAGNSRLSPIPVFSTRIVTYPFAVSESTHMKPISGKLELSRYNIQHHRLWVLPDKQHSLWFQDDSSEVIASGNDRGIDNVVIVAGFIGFAAKTTVGIQLWLSVIGDIDFISAIFSLSMRRNWSGVLDFLFESNGTSFSMNFAEAAAEPGSTRWINVPSFELFFGHAAIVQARTCAPNEAERGDPDWHRN